ncbi:MAG: DUF86 domain-containing protein [Chloroflexi bacterium]|nr:DUF86 domain-containing protein [Chloroflexota bacterium]
MQRDDATLLDIAKAARLVSSFIQGMTKESFLDDIKTQSSVLYQLAVIGEAVKRLSSELRAQRTDVPWQLIAGMRDHVIHGYDVVDWNEVWKTATKDVPNLLAKIEPLLPKKAK